MRCCWCYCRWLAETQCSAVARCYCICLYIWWVILCSSLGVQTVQCVLWPINGFKLQSSPWRVCLIFCATSLSSWHSIGVFLLWVVTSALFLQYEHVQWNLWSSIQVGFHLPYSFSPLIATCRSCSLVDPPSWLKIRGSVTFHGSCCGSNISVVASSILEAESSQLYYDWQFFLLSHEVPRFQLQCLSWVSTPFTPCNRGFIGWLMNPWLYGVWDRLPSSCFVHRACSHTGRSETSSGRQDVVVKTAAWTVSRSVSPAVVVRAARDSAGGATAAPCCSDVLVWLMYHNADTHRIVLILSVL